MNIQRLLIGNESNQYYAISIYQQQVKAVHVQCTHLPKTVNYDAPYIKASRQKKKLVVIPCFLDVDMINVLCL